MARAGFKAGAVQAVDEAVQRGMVGVLVPSDRAGAGGDGVRAGGEGRSIQRPNAHPRSPLRYGDRRPRRLHRGQGRRPLSRRRRPVCTAA